MTQPYHRSSSVIATAAFAANISPDVREQRAQHFQERDRRQRLAAARANVENARMALQQVRDTSAEEAALDAALKRLAEVEGETK
ncbi:hypothetical protein [Bradyrhizobium sp. SZCCHNR1039]|uniref:hypothetical protein n=1 Tax=Bradyrhizobium sp. SZCCHNR1039 TaxID=3057350 RepID=UPI002916C857|nr:hypothetical protein [Bradyrhizobium sp. SZCCHNR1039]